MATSSIGSTRYNTCIPAKHVKTFWSMDKQKVIKWRFKPQKLILWDPTNPRTWDISLPWQTHFDESWNCVLFATKYEITKGPKIFSFQENICCQDYKLFLRCKQRIMLYYGKKTLLMEPTKQGSNLIAIEGARKLGRRMTFFTQTLERRWTEKDV